MLKSVNKNNDIAETKVTQFFWFTCV